MKDGDVARTRIKNQQITSGNFQNASDVVSWFGCMQAQDFAAAKWAVALRTKNLTEKQVDEAFNKGEILRTHIMRPTWHFVTPKEIRWILSLTSPRVHRFNGYYYRQTGLDKSIFQKSNKIIREALQGGKQLTRTELNIILKEHNIPMQNLGLSYTIMQAELDGIICSGPRTGKQFTYMLLDERVPKTKEISYDEALGELSKHFFQSHGPALIQDFVWWSGLTAFDAKRGVEIAKLKKEIVNEKIYWFSGNTKSSLDKSVYLIPPFDEYFVAYKDRSDILDERYQKNMNFGGGMINGAIVIDGIVVGTWRRTFRKSGVHILLMPFTNLTTKEYKEVEKSAKRYGEFIGMGVEIKIKS